MDKGNEYHFRETLWIKDEKVGILKVFIPNHSFQEISYTINCLLDEFLGLEYELVKKDINSTVISSDKGILTIKNHFFKVGKKPICFDMSCLPSAVTDAYLGIDGKEFPILTLYGSNELHKRGEELELDSDIIASTFFMLSRWEEYINPERDNHNRFQATQSIAYKYGFLERPIVNEYVEFLWAILKYLGCKQKRKVRSFEIVPTHDVDVPYLFEKGIKKNIRKIGGFVKRGSFAELFRYVSAKLINKDPWDTHDLFMNLSERKGVKSHFFFLPRGNSKFDQSHKLSDDRVKKLIRHIIDRGHSVGLHPSYNAYNDRELFENEKYRLTEVLGHIPTTGRQHYLRFEVPTTWQIWEAAGMEWDSSVCYADSPGFRCGVAYPFPVFDVQKREKLKLYERPLIVMETSLVHYEELSIEQIEAKVDRLKSEVKKYNGEFVFLYHNSSFLEKKYHRLGDRVLHALYN